MQRNIELTKHALAPPIVGGANDRVINVYILCRFLQARSAVLPPAVGRQQFTERNSTFEVKTAEDCTEENTEEINIESLALRLVSGMTRDTVLIRKMAVHNDLIALANSKCQHFN